MDDIQARLIRLEERYTHLQHHIAEQDRVILGLSEELDRLRRELARVRDDSTRTPGAGDAMPADERPPHY